MNAFQAQLPEFETLGGTIYGISVDSPFAQNAFRERLGLEYGLISDANRKIIDKYDVSMDWETYNLNGFAKRAVFVVNETGHIIYSWVADDLKTEPEYDELVTAVEHS
jgi:peroxiredoxin